MRWIRHPGQALDAYVDGELDGRDVDRVAAHLGHCVLCRQRAVIIGEIRRALRSIAGWT